MGVRLARKFLDLSGPPNTWIGARMIYLPLSGEEIIIFTFVPIVIFLLFLNLHYFDVVVVYEDSYWIA